MGGFPGNTERYLTSYGIDFAINQKNPAIIDVFGTMLDVMKTQMDADPAIRIELASDHAGIANVWKYFIGQTRGLKRLDVKAKRGDRKGFYKLVQKNDETNEKYGNVLQNLQAAYQQMEGTITPFYLIAIGSSNIECLNLSMQTVVMEEMLEKKKKIKRKLSLLLMH